MYNAYLHVLHVTKESSLLETSTGLSASSCSYKDLSAFTARWLPDQAKMILALRSGQPHKEIVHYAAEEDIDLIVIATHGRNGLNHFVMGSVAEKVVRFSPAPVLTVKPRRAEEIRDARQSVQSALSEADLPELR